jgi:acyl carrier protein
MLRGLVRAGTRRTADAGDGSGAAGLAQRLAGLTGPERDRVLLDVVLSHTATVLGHSSVAAVKADRGFLELGFDSLTAVELRNRLNIAAGLRLPSTLIFDHPTPAALARFLGAEIHPDGRAPAQPGLGELEKFAAVVAADSLDSGARTRLSKRLRTLLWQLENGSAAPGASAASGASAAPGAPGAPELGDATDDEMFALIDKELGRA